MQLPNEVNHAISTLLENYKIKEMASVFHKTSGQYQQAKNGERIVTTELEAVVYAITRMPSTYCAVRRAWELTLQVLLKQAPKMWEELSQTASLSLLDVGAGTGASVMASSFAFSFGKIMALEREENMINVGKFLLHAMNDTKMSQVIWKKVDFCELLKGAYQELEEVGIKDNEQGNENTKKIDDLFKADVVVASYFLNEYNWERLSTIVKKLWNLTNQILLIVEPGTPKDYQNIMKIKELLVQEGAHVIAPCTTYRGCDLPKEDWCHFTCRVERTQLQRLTKEGQVPYEDEKFTFLAVSKFPLLMPKARIIRPPIVSGNQIEVHVCEEGKTQIKRITKNEAATFRRLKKCKTGDLWGE